MTRVRLNQGRKKFRLGNTPTETFPIKLIGHFPSLGTSPIQSIIMSLSRLHHFFPIPRRPLSSPNPPLSLGRTLCLPGGSGGGHLPRPRYDPRAPRPGAVGPYGGWPLEDRPRAPRPGAVGPYGGRGGRKFEHGRVAESG